MTPTVEISPNHFMTAYAHAEELLVKRGAVGTFVAEGGVHRR